MNIKEFIEFLKQFNEDNEIRIDICDLEENCEINFKSLCCVETDGALYLSPGEKFSQCIEWKFSHDDIIKHVHYNLEFNEGDDE